MTISDRIRVRRGSKRAIYDQAEIYRILDENLLCHVGFVDGGEARIIPTAYIRRDDAIYLHGNRQNRMLLALTDGQTACVSVTRLDGLVLARSGFHHSVNYQSVVLFGKAEAVDRTEDAIPVLDAFVDKLAPGRSAEMRPHTSKELNATLVLRIPIAEASAKVRRGPPIDDEADYALDVWAGVVPLVTTTGAFEPCPRLATDTPLPDHLANWTFSG